MILNCIASKTDRISVSFRDQSSIEWHRRVDSRQTILPAVLADTLDEFRDEIAASLPDVGTLNRFQWIDGDNDRNDHRD
jgi:hypothetical protein